MLCSISRTRAQHQQIALYRTFDRKGEETYLSVDPKDCTPFSIAYIARNGTATQQTFFNVAPSVVPYAIGEAFVMKY